MGAKKRRRWVVPVVVAFLAFVMIMMGGSAYFMSQWSRLEQAAPSEANRAFAEARVLAGGGTPYVTVSATHQVQVHRELEGPSPVPLETLHLVVWDPGHERLLRVDYPFWFVRLKLSSAINLGTMVSVLAQDWENLDLKVAEDDLQRRGPGLILDIKSADGALLLLWTE